MNWRQMFLAAAVLSGMAFQAVAADWYVSISTGKNNNAGTKEAPFKNLWKGIEKAAPGDTLHIAEGNYPGKMSCGWINMTKPVNLIGGYKADFSLRDPLVHHTMLRPTNAQNATRPTFGTLTIKTRKFGPNSNILIDGFIFDHTNANSYHGREGKPQDGMVSVKNNIGLKDPALFKNVIDMKYLEAFLNATYTEKVSYDENSSMNQFRAALGLNKQGKITSKVSMFANPYPFDSAIKFFGAVQGVGAQKPAAR